LAFCARFKVVGGIGDSRATAAVLDPIDISCRRIDRDILPLSSV
jgi:hypothetical protein